MSSPLLANVALHGLEQAVKAAVPKEHRREKWTPAVVRYADDFVVLHQDLAVIEALQQVVTHWLEPCRAAQQRHLAALARIIHQSQGDTQAVLIQRLTPAIRGWATYHRHVVAAKVFHRADDQVYYKLRRWAHRRHHNKRERWIISRYWRTRGTRRWVFTPEDGPELARHTDVQVTRHVKVQGARSPFDGAWTYWASRLGTYPGVLPSQARLLRLQAGRCAGCGLYVRPGDLLETDHVVPRSRG